MDKASQAKHYYPKQTYRRANPALMPPLEPTASRFREADAAQRGKHLKRDYIISCRSTADSKTIFNKAAGSWQKRKEIKRTIRQHYVPRSYLAEWCQADGNLWSFDKKSGKSFNVGPDYVRASVLLVHKSTE